MIRTAEQLLAEIDGEDGGRHPVRPWRYPSQRRSRLEPPRPCKNADRGCTGDTGGKRCGHGWCENCYSRWRRHGDSWHHSPNHRLCRKKCFMGHNKEQ